MFKGFRDFILRGNVVDLAVAVIIGAAFSQITSALTSNIITPFISALVGAPDFSNLVFHMHVFHQAATPCIASATVVCPGDIHYGIFLNAVINFLLNAGAIYFLIVLPVHHLLARINGPSAITTRPCPECLSEIPLAARRCKACGEALAA